MAGFTAALGALSIGTQIAGQVTSGQDAKKAAEFNASVFQQQAQNIDVKKNITTRQFDRALRQLKGETVVNVASQNRDLSGSALAILSDSIEQVELDKAVELFNLDTDKNRALTSSQEFKIRGKRESRKAITNATTTLLTQGNDWFQKFGGFGQTK